MTVRTARLTIRAEGIFAFTAANRAAREKKLAASSPKNKMNIATNRRGRKTKESSNLLLQAQDAEHAHTQQNEAEPGDPEDEAAQHLGRQWVRRPW